MDGPIVETSIPARLDRLPWGGFHNRVVAALGVTWILDGLEVTLAGALSGALKESPALHFTNTDIGLAASAYLTGAVLGAVFFGWLTDRLGRKKLFFLTLALYLVATAATAASWDIWSFVAFRFFTGAGIGGEYTAINSTIQELVPSRVRGWTDLVINGSFWIGAALAGGLSIVLLDPRIIDPEHGWRLAFFGGAAIGLAILFLRRYIPESPRWLIIHGHADKAEMIVAGIEERFIRAGHSLPPPGHEARLRSRSHTRLGEVFAALFRLYPRRTMLGLCLMIAQAFFYNAIFFTYAMMLTDFYGVPSDRTGYYVLPFALGNVLGPLLLGRLFDTVGRKAMIVLTYAASGILLAISGLLFQQGLLDATSQTLCWSVTFFFASAAASSAYLTVAESFPIEVRALAIAIFYALGTGIGGVLAPWAFSLLIESGSRDQVLLGYLFAAALMGLAALAAALLGIASERQPLESVARPLSWEEV